MNDIQKQAAELELKKFFSLIDNEMPYFMPRCIVDTVWHEKLKDAENYNEFCMEYNGNYIEHMENKGKGFLPWMEKYEEEYGKMTQEWFTDSSGKVLKDLYGKYIEEGDIQLEWDCVPIATTD